MVFELLANHRTKREGSLSVRSPRMEARAPKNEGFIPAIFEHAGSPDHPRRIGRTVIHRQNGVACGIQADLRGLMKLLLSSAVTVVAPLPRRRVENRVSTGYIAGQFYGCAPLARSALNQSHIHKPVIRSNTQRSLVL